MRQILSKYNHEGNATFSERPTTQPSTPQLQTPPTSHATPHRQTGSAAASEYEITETFIKMTKTDY